jgi:signal transduction histidine kinase
MSTTEPSYALKFDLKDRKILLVDDDRINLHILAGILRPHGVLVTEASSGEDALAKYAQTMPDLVLLDVMMPGINGFETCRQLKKTYGEACSPVIFITAKSEADDIVEGLEAGGVDYLPKPFRPKEAIARIKIHLQNRSLHEQEKQLVEQLSHANAAKNRLLGMAAHDLRNPLASIRALAEFLSDGTVGPLAPDQLDLVKTIHEASQSMLTLVNELLDLSVIEAGELKISPKATSLGELIAKSVGLANVNASKKGTTVQFADASGLPKVMIDGDKIKQVVDNLLSNAIKFSPPKAVIRVSLTAAAGRITVAVRDQGPGIPEGERGKLFKDFGKTSVKPTGGEKSTGLGLAICKKLIEAHRGTICADNEPDGGCTFKFFLPVAP